MAESSDTTTTTSVTTTNGATARTTSIHGGSGSPPPPPPPPPPPVAVVVSPCAACKTLRRRCADKCILAPYFPPSQPLKFTLAHRVFGASNIIKFLQELPEAQRPDAVSSMVYEANARIRDPVYGCAGTICQLQTQVNELQGQLAKAKAELVKMQCQQTNLLAFLCKEMAHNKSPHYSHNSSQSSQSPDQSEYIDNNNNAPSTNNVDACFIDDNIVVSSWEALWG